MSVKEIGDGDDRKGDNSPKIYSFLHNFVTISRLTKLHKCFLFGFPFSMDGLIKSSEEKGKNSRENNDSREEVGKRASASTPLLSPIDRYFFIPIVVIVLAILFICVYAYANNTLANNVGELFDTILGQRRDEFFTRFYSFFGLAVLGTVANTILLFLGEYLCLKLLRIYLINVVTNHYYLTGGSDHSSVHQNRKNKNGHLGEPQDRDHNVISNYQSVTPIDDTKKRLALADHNHFLLIHVNKSGIRNDTSNNDQNGKEITEDNYVIEDPEVRINVDIEIFCAKLKLILFGTPMYLGYLPAAANSIYYLYTLFKSYGKFLPIGVVVTFVISLAVSIIIGSFAAIKAKKVEENNSYVHTFFHFIAVHGESIALLQGEAAECDRLFGKDEEEEEDQNSNAAGKKETTEDQDKSSGITKNLGKSLLSFTFISLFLNFFTLLLQWSNSFVTLTFPGFAWIFFSEMQFVDVVVLTNSTTTVFYTFVALSTYVLLAQEWTELIAVTQRIAEMLRTLLSLGSSDLIYGEESEDGPNDSLLLPTEPEGDDKDGDGGGGRGEGASASPDEFKTIDVSRRCRWVQDKVFSPLVVSNITVLQPSYLFAKKEQKRSMFLDNNNEVDKLNSLILMRNVTFTVATPECHSLLIMGPSGIGKSTLLRVIARLWPAAGGYIKHPPMTISDDNSNQGENDGFAPGYMMFLPQRPYISPGGSLAAQVTFPLPPPPSEDEENENEDFGNNNKEENDKKRKEIYSILRLLGLSTLIERYDIFAPSQMMAKYVEQEEKGGKRAKKASKNDQEVHVSSSSNQRQTLSLSEANASRGSTLSPTPHLWSTVLSNGELQRVGIARLLFHKPHIAVLDEATSAMDEYSENIALTALRSVKVIREGNNGTPNEESSTAGGSIHLLTVAHRSTVKAFHEWILNISPDGKTELTRNAEVKKFD